MTALAPLVPLPLVVLPGANIIQNDGTMVQPDVVVVDPRSPVRSGVGVAPADLLLVVEVTSPSTQRIDRTLKADLYRDWAVPYVLVDRQAGRWSLQGTLPAWAEVPRSRIG